MYQLCSSRVGHHEKSLVVNTLTLFFESRLISNVEKVSRSANPIYDMENIQFHKLALWFPHVKVGEHFILKFYVPC